LIKQIQRKRERVTFFGAIDIKSGQLSAKTAKVGNAKSFKRFLKKILFDFNSRGKITIVLDNVRFHHANLLKPFLEKNKNRLQLLFLPAYSPDLNPIEHLWWFVRKRITHCRSFDNLIERKKFFWQMLSHYMKPNEEIKRLCIVNY
jgi:transposase